MRNVLYLLAFIALSFSLTLPAYAQGRRGGRGNPFANFERNKPLAGDKAPGFELEDTDGKKHKLSKYKGKFVVLEFGALT
ncbi:MAG: redoxin domain-containing protein [Planctomycetota bacterium]|jgi:cytochrome oxidase Cu insertion factor (SCO1/SenC/PrrC family)